MISLETTIEIRRKYVIRVVIVLPVVGTEYSVFLFLFCIYVFFSSSSSSSSSSDCSSGSSRPPGSYKKRTRKRWTINNPSLISVKKSLLNLIHFHRESSVERKMCPTQQHRHDWSHMDATGRMNELYHDTSGHRETHFTSPFSGGPVAPLPSTSSATLHSGYFSHKSGVPRNHPFHDSVGRHAWNVPYPDKNRFQFSRPPPTVMVCL